MSLLSDESFNTNEHDNYHCEHNLNNHMATVIIHIKEEPQDVDESGLEFLDNSNKIHVNDTLSNARANVKNADLYPVSADFLITSPKEQHVKIKEKDDQLELSKDVIIKEEPLSAYDNEGDPFKLPHDVPIKKESPLVSTDQNEDNPLELHVEVEIKEERQTSTRHNETHSSHTGYNDGAFTNNSSSSPVIEKNAKQRMLYEIEINTETDNTRTQWPIQDDESEQNYKTKFVNSDLTIETEFDDDPLAIQNMEMSSPEDLPLETILKESDEIYTNEVTFKFYYCDNCDYKTVSKNCLVYHMNIHDKNRSFICDICSFNCKTKNELIKHLNVHNEKNEGVKINTENLYNCKNCPYKSTSEKGLERHLLNTKDGTTYSCNIYTEKNDLNGQIVANSEENPFSCSICTKMFKYKGNLKRHMFIHTSKERPHSCHICEKTFQIKGNLKRHMLIHSRDKNHTCNICSKEFTEKSSLKLHLLTHSGEKPHTCSICAKKFTQRSHLKGHLLTHSKLKAYFDNIRAENDKDKPYFCNMCTKKFKEKSGLKLHLLTHTGEEPHACDICSKRFTQKSHLERHLLTHTGEKPYSCNICAKKFTQRFHLTSHLVTHSGEKPHSCELCPKRFTQKHRLRSHMLKHIGETPFSCNICIKKFTQKNDLTRHLWTHSDKKPHSCNMCSYCTTHLSSLKRHLLTHSKGKV